MVPPLNTGPFGINCKVAKALKYKLIYYLIPTSNITKYIMGRKDEYFYTTLNFHLPAIFTFKNHFKYYLFIKGVWVILLPNSGPHIRPSVPGPRPPAPQRF